MAIEVRKATMSDIGSIKKLIRDSVRGLSRDEYSPRQIKLSIESVFGVDVELITDETYFVAQSNGVIVGCGGWSKRRTLYGASSYTESRNSALLDPAAEAAKIRAFFIHPSHARKGIGTVILDLCESEAVNLGFKSAEMMATLPGVKLYEKRGYSGTEQVSIPVGADEHIICVKMAKNLIRG